MMCNRCRFFSVLKRCRVSFWFWHLNGRLSILILLWSAVSLLFFSHGASNFRSLFIVLLFTIVMGQNTREHVWTHHTIYVTGVQGFRSSHPLFVYYLEHIQAIGVVVSAVANLVSRPLFYFIFSLLYNLKLAHCWRSYSFIYMRTLLSHGIRNTSSWFTRFFFCYFELSYAQQKRKRKNNLLLKR